MKGFYIENFVLRLIVSLVGMFAFWFAIQYVVDVLIFHEQFHVGILDFVIPAFLGVYTAITWKPKN
jgi:hypothetical protein